MKYRDLQFNEITHVSFSVIQRYLLNRNWEKIESKREQLAVFFKSSPSPIEILLPLSREYDDYDELIYRAIQKISLSENRSFSLVLNDLILPPADSIQFRVCNHRTERGIIPFNEGFSLLENAKKSLLSIACDVVSPTLYHKRMTYKAAKQFIDSCFLGQTQKGSYVASIICPFVNETADDKPNKLTLFNTENELSDSLTRKITQRYMGSLNTLKSVIESDNHEALLDPEQESLISLNFIESIVELGEYGESEEIDISANWSYHTKDSNQVPQSVIFTKDHIAPMEYVVNRLKEQHEEISDGIFVGRVSKAEAEPDPDNRSRGEIQFHFLDADDKIVKAKVVLNTDDFSKACDAIKSGANVKVSGRLISSGKAKLIENASFDLLN